MAGRALIRFFGVLAAGVGAAAVAAGELRTGLSVASAAVAGGRITYNAYLPEADGARTPVVYLLHGFGADDREWLDLGGVAETLDRMIGAGEIGPLIAVMPEAGKSWYVDSARFGGPGDYETAILRDLIPAIDAAYPTLPDRAHRGIAGVSMGGFGALRLAFAHPDVFGAVVGLSAGLFKPGGVSWLEAETTAEAEMDAWFPKVFGPHFDVGVYSAQTPFAYAPGMADEAAPPAIMLIVGDDDYFQLHDGAAELYLDLRSMGLKPELRVGDGGHDWTFWRGMEGEAFRFLDAALQGPTP